MARQDLVAALKNALERGYSIQEAKNSLLNAGYNRTDIEEAAKKIETSKFPKKTPQPLTNILPKLQAYPQKGTPTKKPFIKTPDSYTPLFSKSKKKSHLLIIIIILIVIIIVIFAFVFLAKTSSSKQIDCKNNADCILQVTTTCKSAKATITSTSNILGAITIITSYYEISKQDKSCIIKWIIGDSSLTISEETKKEMLNQGTSLEDIQKAEEDSNQALQQLKGKGEICEFSSSESAKTWLNDQVKSENAEVGINITLNSNQTYFLMPPETAICTEI